jgi:hypothetical protein
VLRHFSPWRGKAAGLFCTGARFGQSTNHVHVESIYAVGTLSLFSWSTILRRGRAASGIRPNACARQTCYRDFFKMLEQMGLGVDKTCAVAKMNAGGPDLPHAARRAFLRRAPGSSQRCTSPRQCCFPFFFSDGARA